MRRTPSNRDGYSLVIVAVFLALFFSMLAVASQNLTAGLRREKIQMLREQRDEGSLRLGPGPDPAGNRRSAVQPVCVRRQHRYIQRNPRRSLSRLRPARRDSGKCGVAPANPLDTLSAMPSSFGTTVIIER